MIVIVERSAEELVTSTALWHGAVIFFPDSSLSAADPTGNLKVAPFSSTPSFGMTKTVPPGSRGRNDPDTSTDSLGRKASSATKNPPTVETPRNISRGNFHHRLAGMGSSGGLSFLLFSISRGAFRLVMIDSREAT